MLNKCEKIAFLFIFFLIAVLGNNKLYAGETQLVDAMRILKLADDYRSFRGKSFIFDLKLISYRLNKSKYSFDLSVEVMDSHRSLVIYRSPAKEKGKAILMNGRNMWFHAPNIRNAIRITPQQRLLGEASNGDVANTDFSGDYLPVFKGEEIIKETLCYRLELNARDKSATYHKIDFWVKKSNYAPFMAKFYALSGKHLKTAYYRKFKTLKEADNKEQLVEIEIINPFKKGSRTVMQYSNFVIKDIPATHFKPEYLKGIR